MRGIGDPSAAAGGLAIQKALAAQGRFFSPALRLTTASGRRLSRTKKGDTLRVAFWFAESEGFEPPEPRRVQQISSLPRSTTPATFRGKNTTFFAMLGSGVENFPLITFYHDKPITKRTLLLVATHVNELVP